MNNLYNRTLRKRNKGDKSDDNESEGEMNYNKIKGELKKNNKLKRLKVRYAKSEDKESRDNKGNKTESDKSNRNISKRGKKWIGIDIREARRRMWK